MATPPHRASRRAQRHEEKVAARRRRILVLAAAAAVLVLGVGATVLALTRSDDAEEEKTENVLRLAEYSISGNLAVEAGDVELVAANGGEETHTLGVRNGPITALLMPGRASKLQLLDLAPGTYELYCRLHEDRGMVSTLQVVALATGSDPADTD